MYDSEPAPNVKFNLDLVTMIPLLFFLVHSHLLEIAIIKNQSKAKSFHTVRPTFPGWYRSPETVKMAQNRYVSVFFLTEQAKKIIPPISSIPGNRKLPPYIFDLLTIRIGMR